VTLSTDDRFPLIGSENKRSVFICLGFVYLNVVGPVMWHLWINHGTGNANFFYAMTLIFFLFQVRSCFSPQMRKEEHSFSFPGTGLADSRLLDLSFNLGRLNDQRGETKREQVHPAPQLVYGHCSDYQGQVRVISGDSACTATTGWHILGEFAKY